MENPYDGFDLEVFYTSTNIIVENGAHTSFWGSPWVNGSKPKEIAPLIFEASKRKRWKGREAMKNDALVGKIKPPNTCTLGFIREFITLWVCLHNTPLWEDVEDDIVWKITLNGHYSAAYVYHVQLLGTIHNSMKSTIWKPCAASKVKFFGWLADLVEYSPPGCQIQEIEPCLLLTFLLGVSHPASFIPLGLNLCVWT